jgi:hypothetical protein
VDSHDHGFVAAAATCGRRRTDLLIKPGARARASFEYMGYRVPHASSPDAARNG